MKAVFLSGAEEDLKELRRYLIKRFGKSTWSDTYGKIKTSVRGLQTFPWAGSVPEEFAGLGLGQYRQVISGMNRIIYAPAATQTAPPMATQTELAPIQ